MLTSPFFLRVFSIWSLAISVTLLFLAITQPAKFPAQASLAKFTGRIESATLGKYSVAFRFVGDSRNFDYARKGGESQDVLSELRLIENQPVTILFDAEHPGKPTDASEFYKVFEIRTPRKVIRSYDAIREAWSNDLKLAYPLVIFFGFGCAFLWRVAAKHAKLRSGGV